MLTIQECVYEGIYIVRLEGRIVLGLEGDYFRAYFKRRIDEGVRFFIIDCRNVPFLDSVGFEGFGGIMARVKMRAGRTVFIKSPKISELFKIGKLDLISDSAKDLSEAFNIIFEEPIKVPAELKFEDQYKITMEGPKGAQKLVVEDKMTHPPQRTEFTIRDIPPPKHVLVRDIPGQKSVREVSPPELLNETQSPERLSIVGMAGVAFGTLAFLSVLIVGLIWVTKQVSSVPVLVLIFSVAFLVCLLLLGLLLLLSGHLSEKTVEKLFSGVLSKIPGLSLWLPKAAAKGRTKHS